MTAVINAVWISISEVITEPEWTPEGVFDFCLSRNRTWSRIFE